jgi:hypothetical protein
VGRKQANPVKACSCCIQVKLNKETTTTRKRAEKTEVVGIQQVTLMAGTSNDE